ncbi:MAG: hypothetical protein E6K94_07700 [Thaumarchaeota archaeon]|nr:MAG: hypothetical protein E6K94_07700 [Nitrososphaerota archaeon]
MEYVIKGKIHDPQNNPLSNISVTAFDEDRLSSDDRLGNTKSADDGNFEISFGQRQFDLFGIEGEPEVYLIIFDDKGKFLSVRDRQGYYKKETENGNTMWKGLVLDDISNLDKYDITVTSTRRIIPEEYEAVVIGSGFGGTIISLTLANYFSQTNKKVCILERGQWWVSHEMPLTSDGTIDGTSTIREYLEKNNMPYSLWAYPNNTNGFLSLIGNTRIIDKVRGLYDYRKLKNVGVVTASGVGGGSLVYFNITERPEHSVYESWATQNEVDHLDTKYSPKEVYDANAINYVEKEEDIDKKSLDYFDIAQNFIGVNTITTNASMGKFKLPRTHAFQDAAQKISDQSGNIINDPRKDAGGKTIPDENEKPILDFDARLSISDIPSGLFAIDKENKVLHPTRPEINKYSRPNQTNSCQRQGRCGLGCIPGARHTLNKQLHNALTNPNIKNNIDIFALCQVDRIEETKNNPDYKYIIFFSDYADSQEPFPRQVLAKSLILAAGTLGSTEIMLRSNTLDLSNELGKHFSTNGDMFGVITPTKEIVDSSRGPMQTSLAKFKDKQNRFSFSIEDLGIPKMFGEVLPPMLTDLVIGKQPGKIVPRMNLIEMFNRIIMNKINEPETMNQLSRLITGLDIKGSRILRETLADILADLNRITLDKKTRLQSAEERLYHTLLLFGIGVDKKNGQLTIDENNNINLMNDYDLNQDVFKEISDAMKLFAAEIGRDGENNLALLFWSDSEKQQISAHPLGGCPMGNGAEDGVVNSFGQVFKGKTGVTTYENLYVVDGSIIPSALGVNPSLTISALAFRAAKQVLKDISIPPLRSGDVNKYLPK